MYINKTQILGNLTRDPELKSTPSGAQVCSFSVATNEVYYDKDKQKKEKVEFHNVVVWGKAAENVARYMKKGSQIYIEGKLSTRSWDKDGVKQYRTEIVADIGGVQFGNKPAGSSAAAPAAASDAAPIEYPDGDDINAEDIPF